MTQIEFQRAAGISAGLAARWYPHLITTFTEFGIQSAAEQAMFIAQVGHESGGFKATVESFNYKVDALMRTFGPFSRSKRLSHQQCTALGRTIQQPAQQEAIANLVYGGRMGNRAAGDGWKYRGRGLIQITGLNNYRACGAALKLDLVAAPELLEDDLNAIRSAGWFWNANNCGRFSDDVERCTLVVNGGRNGLAERRELYERAMRALA